jgi:hypothetical protein
VPWAWVSEGSGGAATRWVCTGMGCLLSRLTRSWCECECDCDDDDDDWPGDLDVEGLLPIFYSLVVRLLAFSYTRRAGQDKNRG